MYGLVNRAIQRLILSAHGHATWGRIAARAGCEDVEFVGLETYDDALTYGLVEAASAELGAPVPALLEAFGEYWMRFVAEEGYGPLLAMTASNFEGFLGSLDELHARIAFTYPRLRPPSFDLLTSGEDAWTLRYESERAGLGPMVVGLLRALAERFGRSVEVTYDDEPAPSGRTRLRFSIRALATGEGGDSAAA